MRKEGSFIEKDIFVHSFLCQPPARFFLLVRWRTVSCSHVADPLRHCSGLMQSGQKCVRRRRVGARKMSLSERHKKGERIWIFLIKIRQFRAQRANYSTKMHNLAPECGPDWSILGGYSLSRALNWPLISSYGRACALILGQHGCGQDWALRRAHKTRLEPFFSRKMEYGLTFLSDPAETNLFAHELVSRARLYPPMNWAPSILGSVALIPAGGY